MQSESDRMVGRAVAHPAIAETGRPGGGALAMAAESRLLWVIAACAGLWLAVWWALS